MRKPKENLLLDFSLITLVIMIVVATAISALVTAKLNQHVWVLKAYDAAMRPEAPKGTDPFSVPEIRENFRGVLWMTYGAVGGGFVILYISLISVVARNSRTINQQRAALEAANADLRAAYEQLRETQERLVQERMAPILNSAGEGICGLDPQGNITFANPAAATLTGWDVEDLIGKPHHDVLHHTRADGTLYGGDECPIYAALREGAARQVDNEVFWKKDGTSFPVEYISTPMRKEGTIIGAVVTFEDITQRKQAEKALRESEMRFRSVAQSASDAIISADERGLIILWNRGAETIFGYAEKEALGTPLTRLLSERYRSAHKTAMVGKTVELEGLRKHGGEFPLELSLGTWMAEDQLFYTAIIRDITERKQAEMKLKETSAELQALQLQLIQAEKMESVGTLAAGIAHEVKNPLSIVLMGVNYLSDQLPPDDDITRSVLQDMDNAVRKADSVIRGLLDFSAAGALSLNAEDLNFVVQQSLLLVKHETDRSHLRVVKELTENLPAVKLDKGKIEQVLVNIFINAIHAMPGGGTLTVRTYAKRLMEVGHRVGSRKADHFRIGDTVLVTEVDDTGTGIPPDKLTKIFDPFFTTKPTGKGTGLGLAVTSKIVALHGGTIDIRNREEGGARVTIMFKAEGRG
ncbi:MAG: PAS domain S-box protein [Candidatus Rokubacteria bacterium]|nr:PAS domain S-box protein [Candidatus Rokubacteria bacterium]